MIGRLYIDERDFDDDPKPADGSWAFVGLVRWAMEILGADGPGAFYCERDIERAELIICLDGSPGPCVTVH